MATLLFSGKEEPLPNPMSSPTPKSTPLLERRHYHTQSAASDASAAGHTPPLAAWGGRRGVRDLTSA